MKPHTFDSTFVPPKLVVQKNSHTISKLKPKIRIIHIVAPEIIKIDAENFRELVQRLTGKPVERKGSADKGDDVSPQVLLPRLHGSKPRKNTESAGVIMQNTQIMKDIEEIKQEENPNAFLSFLADVDGFLLDMNEIPLLSIRTSQINTFGEMPLYN
ncbi:hypothetical protein CDL12_21570 [Handroanthus impetiginosus]|uniref:VQ domain-containing protein n=1 Tax=Handroanthus impetiginosus TaxID=429701 RepID=A0A2G9GKU7_9LAMI|nr:hypothetical protein CDL12_21570 [Handroanthus impetiginosus]